VVALSGETSEGPALFVVDEVGDELVVDEGVISHGRFSRDCASILYVKGPTLFVRRLADGEVIARIPGVHSGSWSNDSNQIALGRRAEPEPLHEQYWISVYDIASGELRDIVPPSEHNYYFWPHFSPVDNSIVYFASEYSGGASLSRISADPSGKSRQIAKIGGPNDREWIVGEHVLPMMFARLHWSANGDQLIYDSQNAEGVSELWAVDLLSTGDAERVQEVGQGTAYQWLGEREILAVDSTVHAEGEIPEIHRITW
jgi:Tol biopolymer transport system component